MTTPSSKASGDAGPTAVGFGPAVSRARAARRVLLDRLAAERAAGTAPLAIARIAADLTDEIVIDVWRSVLADLPDRCGAARFVLIAHGGYGRRELCPFSDIDLMILHDAPAVSAAAGVVATVARRLLQDLFDAGLEVGQSVRSVADAVRLARTDATVFSTLIEVRAIADSTSGSEPAGSDPTGLAARLHRQLARLARRGPRRLATLLVEARDDEAVRYGESSALLEPNVKRSPGGLRDIQLVRWLGFVTHSTPDLEALAVARMLTPRDVERLTAAAEHLTGVRIDLHLSAGRATDDLTREHQQALARARGIEPIGGLLPVECFMRDYFRHTGDVVHVAGNVKARSLRRPRGAGWVAGILGHRVDGRYVVGPGTVGVLASHRAVVAADLAAILRLLELAQLYALPVDVDTWEAIRVAVAEDDGGDARARAEQTPLTAEVRAGFLALFEHPARLGDSLRRLHDVGLLERIIPDFAHARQLLQFNNYHKYTVDEHSLRAVEEAVAKGGGGGWMAAAWGEIGRKRPLLVALLIHDLGKGYQEDHSDVGRRIAVRVAARLGLLEDEASIVEFLVHRHLVMAHLAFRRDASDPALVARFARDVGSPEVLRMLALLTAADVSAVGPGVWTEWKSDLLGDLYARTLAVLDGEGPSWRAAGHRAALEKLLGEWEPDDPVVRIGRQLPPATLDDTDPARIMEELVQLARLPPDGVFVATRWQPDRSTVSVAVGTRESVAPGVFHRVTGALTSQRMEILAADIHTLEDGLVIDHFTLVDPDFAGAPPADRLADVAAAIRAALKADRAPAFIPRINPLAPRLDPALRHPVRVAIDNTSSDTSTIIDVFANDALGLLYQIARTLFDAGLSVRSAKVGTYLDQVVDCFHVTDSDGGKIVDPERFESIRKRLEAVVAKATER